MDVVINVLCVIYLLVLGVQLQGYLSHKRKGLAAERPLAHLDYSPAGEGEASFT